MASFAARGLVLVPSDLTLPQWPERAATAGLNLLGFHAVPPSVPLELLRAETVQTAVARCLELGLEVEYELHAMHDLLPRTLFERDPALFRMDESGARVPEWNLCPSNAQALEIIGENAASLAQALTPTTHRYYCWGDDGRPWCQCPECRGLNDADQALLATNTLLRALRALDPQARTAGLAYHTTLTPPTQVRPEDGVFLEFAPIERRWDRPLVDRSVESHARVLDALDAVIAYFGVDEHSQVLEYWMDASRHSNWKRPAVEIPWHPEVLAADLEFYASKGFRRVTSFGCWLDEEYVTLHGDPPVGEYAAALGG